MSYTRRFSKTIQVHYSGSVSYPASQHGGTTSYSGTAYETVEVDVTVDTAPFDGSVENMKEGVNLLTGAVVATEGAQVASIKKNSNDIGQTIISGFFKTVKSDISQQIAELKTNSEALMMQLQSLRKRCLDKQRQMGVDYARISSRYAKIFSDMNNELDNRVHALDSKVFELKDTAENSSKALEQLVAVPAITAGENAKVMAKISASVAKRQAVETIDKARHYLEVQNETDRILDNCLRNGGSQAVLASPFAVVESVSDRDVVNVAVYTSPLIPAAAAKTLAETTFVSSGPDSDSTIIKEYFNREMANAFTGQSSEHDNRVAEMTSRLFNNFRTN